MNPPTHPLVADASPALHRGTLSSIYLDCETMQAATVTMLKLIGREAAMFPNVFQSALRAKLATDRGVHGLNR